VTQATNAGFAATCNLGAAAASGEYLVFVNNDTIPLRGWLEALVSYAESQPKAAVVGSKLLYPNDTIQHAGVVIGQDRLPKHIYRGFPADHPAVNKSRRFQAVTGACILIARELFLHEGGFDVAFVNGHEDIDLCLRLGEHGYEVHYCHRSVLYHLESASRTGRPGEESGNAELYRSRWSHRTPPDDLKYYGEDGLLSGHHEYRRIIKEIRKVVENSLPVDATVLVVSKGDEELLRLGSGRAWHFPRSESGEYAGYYPADSAEAILLLETLRGRGAQFLIFPQPAFWWLEYYRELLHHLEHRYRQVIQRGQACLIYALHEGGIADV